MDEWIVNQTHTLYYHKVSNCNISPCVVVKEINNNVTMFIMLHFS